MQLQECWGQVLQSNIATWTQNAICIIFGYRYQTLNIDPMHPTLFTLCYKSLTIQAFIACL